MVWEQGLRQPCIDITGCTCVPMYLKLARMNIALWKHTEVVKAQHSKDTLDHSHVPKRNRERTEEFWLNTTLTVGMRASLTEAVVIGN